MELVIDVSIIIPTYNRLWVLARAIESCRSNSCATEIIVIDDGSTDGTWTWLRDQMGLVVLRQPNLGKCWAVNKAFEIAKGKYVRFLDSDDQLVPSANDEQFELAEENSSDIVVGGYQVIDENQQVIKEQAWIECDDFIAQQLGECDSSHYSAFLFKKDFLKDIPHRPDYAFRDDRMLILEAAIKDPKVTVHKEITLMHRVHSRGRLQASSGLKHSAQNYQHVNIYKFILGRLQSAGRLTPRRIKASENILWPLCHWIAKVDVNEAQATLNWIRSLDPDFKIPATGILAFMYNKIGFKATEKILKMRRSVRNG